MAITFTDRELDVMAVLWKRGSGTVAEVREDLSDDFAYTTVLSVLRTLEEKGFVSHVVAGKAHRYVPTVAPNTAGKHALARIRDTIFGGSAESLLMHLVSDKEVDAAQLRRWRALLDERLGARKGGGKR
jgi:BlaI family penicillinase repressor